jgi:hypothetical protein
MRLLRWSRTGRPAGRPRPLTRRGPVLHNPRKFWQVQSVARALGPGRGLHASLLWFSILFAGRGPRRDRGRGYLPDVAGEVASRLHACTKASRAGVEGLHGLLKEVRRLTDLPQQLRPRLVERPT